MALLPTDPHSPLLSHHQHLVFEPSSSTLDRAEESCCKHSHSKGKGIESMCDRKAADITRSKVRGGDRRSLTRLLSTKGK